MSRQTDPHVLRLTYRISQVIRALESLMHTLPMSPGGMQQRHIIAVRTRWQWFSDLATYIPESDLKHWEDLEYGLGTMLEQAEARWGISGIPFNYVEERGDEPIPQEVLDSINALHISSVARNTALWPTPITASPSPSPSSTPVSSPSAPSAPSASAPSASSTPTPAAPPDAGAANYVD